MLTLALRPMQTEATLLANNTQHCWAQHVASVNLHGTTTVLALVTYSLKPVKLLGPCKRTQLCWPNTPTTRNNVVTCCVRLHGPLRSCFAVWLRNLSIAWQRILKFKNNFFNKCFMTHLTCKPAVLYWLH